MLLPNLSFSPSDSPGRNKEAEESGHAGRALLCKPKDPPEDASHERKHQSPSHQNVLMRGAPTSLKKFWRLGMMEGQTVTN